MDELAHRIRRNLVRIFILHEGIYDRSFVTHGSVSQFNRWLRSLLRHDPCLVSTFAKPLVFWSNKPTARPINESAVKRKSFSPMWTPIVKFYLRRGCRLTTFPWYRTHDPLILGTADKVYLWMLSRTVPREMAKVLFGSNLWTVAILRSILSTWAISLHPNRVEISGISNDLRRCPNWRHVRW